MSCNDMKVVVSGANGFIGKNLISYLLDTTELDIYAWIRDEKSAFECGQNKRLHFVVIDYNNEDQVVE